ncbi:heavy metal transport/detoxification protein [Ornithinimicrobium sp. CNJ-824]|uniref:heavy-metal-associated domain-containing protein n=1 Tax=Ornithinimicrobium sp. CNJ-824 TaxID=1904966 RepID=UPI000965341C|nr:heavy-metal-associated domain-containing protein [Ornithinimicrobium sp. CNJ-824]OLT20069.1 heavy metal transport/detoxification protein [Ornithinimicrobium sp. CNJ-824]
MMSATTTTTKTILRAEGFSCPSCVAKIERQVGRIKGVESVKVHFASARIEVVHDPAKASTDDLVAAVAKAGYTAKPAAF